MEKEEDETAIQVEVHIRNVQDTEPTSSDSDDPELKPMMTKDENVRSEECTQV